MSLIRRLLGKAPSVPAHKVGQVELRTPWARLSSTRADHVGCYLTITNVGRSADRLLAAACPMAARVEIHAIKVVGSDIAMRRLENGLAVPADTTLTLKPRGYHLLLRDLKSPLAKGARVPLTLSFEQAGSIALEFPVEDEGPVGDDVLVEKGQPG
jgi:periplasmic copper chaperone A